MINSYINNQLKKNNVNTITGFINVIREECQKIILYSLSKTDFFKYVAFYGGTCLRLFHNLNRYSEDLDFNCLYQDTNIDLNNYVNKCVTDLESFGFKATIKTKPEYDNGDILRRYIVIPISDISHEYFNKNIVNKEQNISIKIEISTEFVCGAKYERKLLASPLFSSVLCVDYPSLFAGKICALLTRNWKSREKGRDFYDYMFYISNEIKVNLDYVKSKLSLSLKKDNIILDMEALKEMLKDRFINTDYELVKKDIMTFVINPLEIDSINQETFLMSLDLLLNTESDS